METRWFYTVWPFLGGGGAIVMVAIMLLSDTFRSNIAVSRWRDAVWLAWLAAPDAFAQANRNGDDQPGLVAAPGDEQLDPKWQKTVVFFRSNEQPGTIVVHTNERYLYVVQPGGRALRYGIGVGRDGFQWQGLVKITQ